MPSDNTKVVFEPVFQEDPLFILYSHDTASDAGVTVTVPSLFGLVGNDTLGAKGEVVSMTFS